MNLLNVLEKGGKALLENRELELSKALAKIEAEYSVETKKMNDLYEKSILMPIKRGIELKANIHKKKAENEMNTEVLNLTREVFAGYLKEKVKDMAFVKSLVEEAKLDSYLEGGYEILVYGMFADIFEESLASKGIKKVKKDQKKGVFGGMNFVNNEIELIIDLDEKLNASAIEAQSEVIKLIA